MTKGKRATQDRRLPNGSIIFWSRRKTIDGRYYVDVRCGGCGAERTIVTSGVNGSFTGLCRECSTGATRTLSHSGEQVLPNGSIIYWDDETCDARYPTRRRVVTVCCGGQYCDHSTRQVPVFVASQPDFTGLCRRCAHFGSASGRWKGGRNKNGQGYIRIKLAADHPFYSMADENGYVLEHRLVAAQKLGRALLPHEIVHHLNGVKDDNCPKNLELLTKHHHAGYHFSSLARDESRLLRWLRRIARRL